MVTYSKQIDNSNTTKEKLYRRAKKWMYETFVKNDILKSEISKTRISATGRFKVYDKERNPFIYYTITIITIPNAYKYRISNFAYYDEKKNKYAIENLPPTWSSNRKIYSKIDEEVNAIIGSMTRAMETD